MVRKEKALKNKKRASDAYPLLSSHELMVKTVGDIIKELLEANERNETVDLNKLKCKAAAKYGLAVTPRLTDIISAVPGKFSLRFCWAMVHN